MRRKNCQFSKHPRWKMLKAQGADAIRREIIGCVLKLSQERPIGSGRWDQQRPAWLPSYSMVCRELGVSSWTDVLIMAGLPPARKGVALGQKRRRMPDGDDIIADIESECVPADWDRRPMVVKCQDSPEREEYRYWDPNAYCWRWGRLYKGGHFGMSGI